ncbi:hypothetical protein I4U23_016139 [Adineta vaga]|nr:hypothetical protein I4U23_016139 [Adineta vaga]
MGEGTSSSHAPTPTPSMFLNRMENKLNEIEANSQLGKYKQSINDLEVLIDSYPNDDAIYKAYDLLGNNLNYLGEHVKGVQAWENSLENLENKIDGMNDEELVYWLNLSIKIARSLFQQDKDGPGFSRTYRNVCFIPTKMNENEKQEWIKNQFEKSLKYYRQVLEKLPEHLSQTKMKIQTEFASVLSQQEHFDEAIEIYEEGFHNYGKVEWIYNAAVCLWKQGKKDLAYKRLEQAIGTDQKCVQAYKMMADYFEEKNEKEKALEYNQKYKFYSWIPNFCQNIQLNDENLTILNEIQSNQGVECIKTKLGNDFSRRSTEFLASICYHHYHGQIDDEAFNQLELRGIQLINEQKDFLQFILLYLIENCSSTCTIKGTANVLVSMKHPKIFEILTKLLYKDTNFHYPMNIPFLFGKLEDPRAIPVLIEFIEKPIKYKNDDLDSSDGVSLVTVETALLPQY